MLDASELPSADCAITILHARGRRLAKLIRTDGSIDSYDKAKHFDASRLVFGTRPLRRRRALAAAVLGPLRGARQPGRRQPGHGIRRLLHADGRPAISRRSTKCPGGGWRSTSTASHVRPKSPSPISPAAPASRSAICRPSSRAGRVSRSPAGPRVQARHRLRLWYWLDGAATYAVLREWFFASPIDLATFRAVQPIYTAAPVLGDGVIDPVPDRLAVLPGAPLVTIRPLPPPQPRQATAAPGRVGQAGQAPRSASSGDF